MLQIKASRMIVIYDRNSFIIQATGQGHKSSLQAGSDEE